MQQAPYGSPGRGLSQPDGGGVLGPAAPMGEGSHDHQQTVMGMADGVHGGGGGFPIPISGISAFLQGHNPSHLVKMEGAGGGGTSALQQHLIQPPQHASAGEGPTDGETASSCSGSDAGQPPPPGFGGGSAGAGFMHAAHLGFFKKEEGSAAKESGSVGTGSEGGSGSGGSKGFKKRAWVAAEDGLLKQLVETHGPKDWNYISGQLQGRSAKQCCERWHNYLKPDIRKDAWRPEEDRLIMDYHHSFCNKWSKIAEYLPGRTGNSVKNRYYCLLRRNHKGSGSGDGDGNGASTPSAASVESSSSAVTGIAEGDALDGNWQRGGGRLARADAGEEASAGGVGGHGGGVSSYAQPQQQHYQQQHYQQQQQQQQQEQHHHYQQQQLQQQAAGAGGGGGHHAYETAPSAGQPAGETVHYTWTPIGWATTTTASVPFPPSPDHGLFFSSAAAAHQQPQQQQFVYTTGADGTPIFATAAPTTNETAPSDHNTHSNTGGATTVMGAAAAASYHTHPSSPQQPLFASAPQDLRFSSSSTHGGPGGGQTISLSFAASYGGGGGEAFPPPMTTSDRYAQQARGGRLPSRPMTGGASSPYPPPAPEGDAWRTAAGSGEGLPPCFSVGKGAEASAAGAAGPGAS